MAKADVSIVYNAGHIHPPSVPYRTEANATAIYAGEPCKVGGTGTNYAIPSADAEPVTSSPTFIGIASSDSTQTASANGVVYIDLALPGMVFRAKAKSAAAVDTDAELLALLNDIVAFDLTAGVYTVETASAASTNGLVIIGGDIVNGTLDFYIRTSTTHFN